MNAPTSKQLPTILKEQGFILIDVKIVTDASLQSFFSYDHEFRYIEFDPSELSSQAAQSIELEGDLVVTIMLVDNISNEYPYQMAFSLEVNDSLKFAEKI